MPKHATPHHSRHKITYVLLQTFEAFLFRVYCCSCGSLFVCLFFFTRRKARKRLVEGRNRFEIK